MLRHSDAAARPHAPLALCQGPRSLQGLRGHLNPRLHLSLRAASVPATPCRGPYSRASGPPEVSGGSRAQGPRGVPCYRQEGGRNYARDVGMSSEKKTT
eukprot:scaffold9353_cov31-Tisochrysis_lutea.AAC.4